MNIKSPSQYIAECESEIANNAEDPIKIWRNAQDVLPSHNWYFAARLASLYEKEGKYEEAKEVLREACERQPYMVYPFEDQAKFLFKHKEWKEGGKSLYDALIRTESEDLSQGILQELNLGGPNIREYSSEIIEGAREAQAEEKRKGQFCDIDGPLKRLESFFLDRKIIKQSPGTQKNRDKRRGYTPPIIVREKITLAAEQNENENNDEILKDHGEEENEGNS